MAFPYCMDHSTASFSVSMLKVLSCRCKATCHNLRPTQCSCMDWHVLIHVNVMTSVKIEQGNLKMAAMKQLSKMVKSRLHV